MAVDPDKYIPVNGALNLKPTLGPIPADQVFPWAVIILGNIFVVKSLMGMSWVITILSCGWGIATWWILTGSDSGKFLSKFHPPPFWLYGCAQSASPLEVAPRETEEPQRFKGKRRRKKLKIQT